MLTASSLTNISIVINHSFSGASTATQKVSHCVFWHIPADLVRSFQIFTYSKRSWKILADLSRSCKILADLVRSSQILTGLWIRGSGLEGAEEVRPWWFNGNDFNVMVRFVILLKKICKIFEKTLLNKDLKKIW